MTQIRVVKIGGSLWARRDFDGLLRDWLARQPASHNVLISGGGVYAEQVRRLHERRATSEQRAHRLAIRAMSLLAWTMSQWVDSSWSYVETWERLHDHLNLGATHQG